MCTCASHLSHFRARALRLRPCARCLLQLFGWLALSKGLMAVRLALLAEVADEVLNVTRGEAALLLRGVGSRLQRVVVVALV